ncbi:MAG TPA: DUF992 domain-containing protein [Stellaceae bacterium]|nr:DUF992 domain-containing protein [Stellaceae bacterium]
MRSKRRFTAGIVALALGAFTLPALAHADSADVKVGMLTCNVASGWGFIFGSSRDLNCTYSGGAGVVEHYSGSVTKFGVDIGYQQSGVLVWAVLAPSSTLAPGALAGSYAGPTASVSVGVGLGANALIGGFDKSIALQPLSVEGNEGLNVAAGIAAMSLTSHQ